MVKRTMPIYEYRCSKCGHQLEVLQKFSDQPLVQCPACQKDGLQKLVSAASFRLKGGGWYETDFKKDNKKHLVDSGDTGATGKADPGADSSSKPAGQAEKKPESGKSSGSGADKPGSAT